MKSKYLIILASFLFYSCGNGEELEIYVDESGCGCIESLERKFDMYNVPCQEHFQDCENLNQDNVREFLKNTNSVYLVNKSRTKTFEATIQLDEMGKVSYRVFNIGITDTVYIDCNKNLYVNTKTYKSGPYGDVRLSCEESLVLENKGKNEIIYKVQKAEVLQDFSE